MRRVTVATDPAYDVVIGPGALAELGPVLAGRARVAVVTQTAIADAWGDTLRAACPPTTEVEVLVIADGEAAKTLATVEDLCRRFATWGLRRSDAVVALGGGLVGDVGGLAAALYHRGVAVVQAPTSLLAMVDAAIGGKTAVNLPEGRNLVGAFHQPQAVVADTAVLATLSERELRSGLGEVAKYALMGDVVEDASGIVDVLRMHTPEVLARDPATLEDLVARCVTIKAAVVACDPEERRGLRATLNYGHTLGHALETASSHALAHGEAVAIGLLFAAALAEAMERVGPDTLDRHQAVIAALGLPVAVPDGSRPGAGELLALMGRDKKSSGGLTLVLPGPSGLEAVDDPPAPALERAFAYVGVRT